MGIYPPWALFVSHSINLRFYNCKMYATFVKGPWRSEKKFIFDPPYCISFLRILSAGRTVGFRTFTIHHSLVNMSNNSLYNNRSLWNMKCSVQTVIIFQFSRNFHLIRLIYIFMSRVDFLIHIFYYNHASISIIELYSIAKYIYNKPSIAQLVERWTVEVDSYP